MAKKITLSSIAKHSGLSIASVSRVVRTPHLTSPKTQDKVYQAMRELEYDLKYHLKEYSVQKVSKKILVIDNQLVSHNLIHQGIEKVLRENGYQLLSLRLYFFDDLTLQKITQYALSHKVAGILVINDAPYLAKLEQYLPALPPVLLMNQFKRKMPCVYFDHLSIAFESTQHCIKNGHQHILLLLSDESSFANQLMITGYRQALQRAGLSFNEDYILHRSNHYDSLNKQLKTYLVEPLKVSAMICADCSDLNYVESRSSDEDYSAEIIDNLLAIFESKGKDALGLFSILFMTHKRKHLTNPRLNFITSIYKPFMEMGETGALKLIEKIEGINNQMQSILIHQQWNERNSIRSLPFSKPLINKAS